MDLSQLSQEQFKELVRGIVDDRLRELLGDPDLGLQLGRWPARPSERVLVQYGETVRRGHCGPTRSPLVRTTWPGIVLPIAQPSSKILRTLEPSMAQRLLDKTKWIASNIDNLRHEPIAPDLPGLSKYAVEDWRIFYSIDRDNHLVDIHGIIRHTEVRS